MSVRRYGLGGVLALGLGLLGCTTPPAAPEALPTPIAMPLPSPTPSPPIPAEIRPTSSPAPTPVVAEQVYTSFRPVPSPCCPPRPLPEVLERLRAIPGIVAAELDGGRLIIRYDPTQLSAADLPILLRLNGLEVAP